MEFKGALTLQLKSTNLLNMFVTIVSVNTMYSTCSIPFPLFFQIFETFTSNIGSAFQTCPFYCVVKSDGESYYTVDVNILVPHSQVVVCSYQETHFSIINIVLVKTMKLNRIRLLTLKMINKESCAYK